MRFDKGDLVQMKETKELVIVVDVDKQKKLYQVQHDSKGEDLEWVERDEVV